MTDSIRVFLVDDHELVRRGIASFLGSATDLLIVGEAATAAQALARVPAVHPDVVLLDVRLPDGSGIDVCRELRVRSPEVACIILTAYDDDDAILASVVAGAAGYIRKDIAGSALVDGIRSAAAGRSLLDAALVARVARHLRDAERGDPRLAGLSRREAEVLALIADGKTNREIAGVLALSEKTVKNYVSSLLSKLGLHTRTQAAVLRAVTESGTVWPHP
ncbi:response regulator transcription factor [Amnibacterium sp.]|uniref:response regulator n=1 Tax=Amnibacterium sp. TaxID=1872496 RepID=UPI0026377AD5|nr:response regulator transcription factor [Amnibacterium sp.]MCU1472427.1 two component transcriptional regulator, LuxR family [Amnibacterium sp.]